MHEFYSEDKNADESYCHFTALKNEDGAERRGEGRETGSEGYTYFAIFGDNINVKVEGGKNTSKLMNIHGVPTVMCCLRVKWDRVAS